jgi:tripartite-type tricarboxylate transporter receptor subunit TctC
MRRFAAQTEWGESMKKLVRSFVCLVLGALAPVLATGAALAQEFPSRTVRIVVPFPPAGAVDILARVVAQKLDEKWRTGVIVENRPGAGTVIGTDVVAKAAPDGYTMVLAVTAHAVNATLMDKLPFDPVKDFAPVVLAATAQNILVAHPALPAGSVRELITHAKANPGKLNVGSPGLGTTMHLAAEMLKSAAGIEYTMVHYKGTQPSLNALLAGEVDFLFDAGVSVPYIESGRLKALAVTSPQRAAILPEVPTMIEAGVPDFVALSWYGFLAPAQTPQATIETLNREINAALKDPGVRERIVKIGLEPAGGSAAEFARHVRDEVAKWGKVVREAGVKAN